MAVRKRALIAATIALLLVAVAAPVEATFSGPVGRITFFRFLPDKDGPGLGAPEIFSAMPDGSHARRLTFSKDGRSSVFSDWSPDGSKVAFDSDRIDQDGRDDVVQIYVMPWNGESHGLKQLTVGPGFHGDPGWSPDGKRIVIEADWGEYPASAGLWIIPSRDKDGVTKSEARRVTTVPDESTFDSEPQFSPNGKWIVFTRFTANGQAIFRVRTDGSRLKRLTNWISGYSAPDWSPDGKRIAFDSGDSGAVGVRGDIWVMGADGDDKTRLTHNPKVTATRFEFANNPSWSPDGRRIAFTQWKGDGSITWIESIRRDGSDVKIMVKSDDFQNKVDWGTHR
jgi:Tol biopolymer transport system component